MALKLKDGLFLGDAETSYDPEFLELNKVSNLVNLAGRDIQNIWAAHGLVYLTYSWDDRPNFRIFSDKESDWDGTQLFPPPLGEIVDFVDGSLQHGISVLLFSSRGQGRCVMAACAYLMCKYNWGYTKAFELITSKKHDIVLNKGFVQQLQALDKYLLTQRGGLKNDNSGPAGPDVPMLDGMRITLDNQELARWREWSTSYLPLPRDDADMTPEEEQEQADAVEERLIINSFINTKHNAKAAQLILPLKSRSQPLKFHKNLVRVQDGSVQHVPVTSAQIKNMGLRSCLRGKGGKKLNKAAFVEPEVKYAEAKESRSPQGQVDLYGFVGVEGGALSSSPPRNMPGSGGARPSSAPLQRNSNNHNNAQAPVPAGLTVEERLHQMITGLGGKRAPQEAQGKGPEGRNRSRGGETKDAKEPEVRASWESEREADDRAARGYNAGPYGGGGGGANQPPEKRSAPALSLYDLANMPLHTSSSQPMRRAAPSGGPRAHVPSYGPTGAFPTRQRPASAQPKHATPQPQSHSGGAKEDDPLAAFGYFSGGGSGGGLGIQSQNRGGPVRTERADAKGSDPRRAPPSDRSMPYPGTSGSGSRRVASPGNGSSRDRGSGGPGLGLEGRSYASHNSRDSADGGRYRRGGGGSNASIGTQNSQGNGSVGSHRSENKRLTPRKKDRAEPQRTGWR